MVSSHDNVVTHPGGMEPHPGAVETLIGAEEEAHHNAVKGLLEPWRLALKL